MACHGRAPALSRLALVDCLERAAPATGATTCRRSSWKARISLSTISRGCPGACNGAAPPPRNRLVYRCVNPNIDPRSQAFLECLIESESGRHWKLRKSSACCLRPYLAENRQRIGLERTIRSSGPYYCIVHNRLQTFRRSEEPAEQHRLSIF